MCAWLGSLTKTATHHRQHFLMNSIYRRHSASDRRPFVSSVFSRYSKTYATSYLEISSADFSPIVTYGQRLRPMNSSCPQPETARQTSSGVTLLLRTQNILENLFSAIYWGR